MSLKSYTTEQLQYHLWKHGKLDYMLHSGQKELAQRLAQFLGRKYVLCCSRRWGKSFGFCVFAIRDAITIPKSQIRYAAPTAKMVRNIIEPHFSSILDTCPEDLKPTYYRQDGVYKFPNKSEIHVAGCDNQGAERLRGVATHRAYVDEAGFITELEYLIQDVLLPQTITTDGRIMMGSTPPYTPAHAFHRYVSEAEEAGNLFRQTIYDAPHVRPEQIEEYCRESGGATSSTWRREYLAEFVVDDSLAVIPEYTDEIVQVLERPPYFHTYVSMDVGYSDLTVALLAYHDFAKGYTYVEDEVVLQKQTSDVIDQAIAGKEHDLWGNKEVSRRVADAPQIVLADIRARASRSWTAARKDDKEAALNALRLAIQQKKLRIHPRCKTLIAHLRNGIWNTSRTSYERSGDFGHFDAIDAAVYLVRHVDRSANPYPVLPDGVGNVSYWIPKQEDRNEDHRRMLFPRRRRN